MGGLDPPPRNQRVQNSSFAKGHKEGKRPGGPKSEVNEPRKPNKRRATTTKGCDRPTWVQMGSSQRTGNGTGRCRFASLTKTRVTCLVLRQVVIPTTNRYSKDHKRLRGGGNQVARSMHASDTSNELRCVCARALSERQFKRNHQAPLVLAANAAPAASAPQSCHGSAVGWVGRPNLGSQRGGRHGHPGKRARSRLLAGIHSLATWLMPRQKLRGKVCRDNVHDEDAPLGLLLQLVLSFLGPALALAGLARRQTQV